MDKWHIYLIFPSLEHLVNGSHNLDDLMENIRFMIDRADCEAVSSIFYEADNLSSFGECLNISAYGTLPPLTAIETLLQDAEAQTIQPSTSQLVFRLWDLSAYQVQIPNNILQALCEDKVRDTIDTKYCVLDFEALGMNWHRYILPIVYDDSTYNSVHKPVMLIADYITTFKALEHFFSIMRMPRTYNHSDMRHIEKSPHYIAGKSPILGGEAYKPRLETLLKEAIGDSSKHKYLVVYDEEKSCYVRFEDENASGQYHGYHLAKANTHERDQDAESKISKRVKDLLEYRTRQK